MYSEYHGSFQGMVIYRPQPRSEMKFWQGGHVYMLWFAKITQQMFRGFADEGAYAQELAL
jgi:hypothetical protein